MDAHVLHSRTGEGEDQHHEKKSVLKKVKAKAKKLKETITGHHDHDQLGHHVTPHHHDLDEEEDDDEDEMGDSKVHGAPMYDSSAKRTNAPVEGDILKVPMVKFGDTKAGRGEYDHVVPMERSNVPMLHGTTGHSATQGSGVAGRTSAPGERGVHFADARHEYDHVVPNEKTSVGYSGPLGDFVPENSPTNAGHENLVGVARIKLAGPTTGPVLKHEEPKGFSGATHTPHSTPVSSLPHGSCDPATTADFDPVKTSGTRQGRHSGEDRQYLNNGANQHVSTGSHDQSSPDKPLNDSTSTEKISSATSAIADKAISAKNVVASKLGYGGTESAHDDQHDDNQHQNRVFDPSSNQFRPSEAPKVRGTIQPDHNTDTQASNQSGATYTDKITCAACAITDKAISAKNVMASKLGYGASDDQDKEHAGGARPMGKVTESEEVRRHLGTTRNDNYVVESVKETVGSMLGRSNKNDEEHLRGYSGSAAIGDDNKRGGHVDEQHRKLQEN